MIRLWELTIKYCDGSTEKLHDPDPYYLLFYCFTAFNNNPRVKKLKLHTVKVRKKEVR